MDATTREKRFTIWWVLPMFGLAGVQASAAESDHDLARCAAMEEPAPRLACFDELVRQRGIITRPPARQQGEGGWRVQETMSPIDDTRVVSLALDADSSITAWPGTRETPTLIIRCRAAETEVYIRTGFQPAIEDAKIFGSVSAVLRFDKDPASAVAMSTSTDGKALFFDWQPVEKIKRMMAHERLLFQFTPFQSSPVVITFTLTGLTESIGPVRGACKW